MVFLAHALFCPFDREAMIACEGFHPVLVVSGALAQDLPADHGNAHDLMEEVHHPLWSRQPAEQVHGETPRDPEGFENLSSAARASGSWKAAAFGWPMRCAYPAPSGPPRRTHHHDWSAGPVLDRNRRCMAAR